MLGLILDEEKIVNGVLNGKLEIDNESKIVNLLIKYYDSKVEGTDNISSKLKIKELILDTMSKCDNLFTRPKWNDYITKQINKYYKNKEKYNNDSKLFKIDKIEIYKEELEMIDSIDDKKLKKLAFVLLVYCKINKKINNLDSNWINISLSNIFKESKITGRYEDKVLLLHNLEKLGFINNNYDGKKVSIEINYIKNNGVVEFEITNFDGVIYKYLNYIGEHWKQCCECRRWVKLKTPNSNQKYCSKCYKKIHKEIDRNYQKNKKID